MGQKIDYTNFRALRKIAMGFAKSRGMEDMQLREDFAQDYCLAVWLGKSRSIGFHYINFLRHWFGRTDKKACIHQRAKSFALRHMVMYEEDPWDSEG